MKTTEPDTRFMEEKINQLLQGQAVMQNQLQEISKQKNDHEKRIRSLEKKFWTSIAVIITGIGTFIEGLFLGKG
jgi:prefoldin subunit 5